MKKIKVLDLFSGIGGFSLGLEAAGFETVAFSEIEPFCDQVLKKHWPKVPNLGDITKLNKENIYERVGRIDCICGGFPCQSVSIAGRKAGFEDRKKSGLWYEYKRLIEEIKPRFVIIENVRNLLNIGFAEVIKDLCDLGYDAEWEVISARSVGARHLRERVWIVAYAHGELLRKQQVCIEELKSQTELRANGQYAAMANPHSVGQLETSEILNTTKRRIQAQLGSSECGNEGGFPNSNLPRLWPTFATEEEAQRWWSEATACISDRFKTEPCFRRVSYGLRAWLDFYLGDEYADETKRELEEILSSLWNGNESKEIREEIGRFREIFETKNMLGILWKYKKESDTKCFNVGGEEIKKGVLRDLRKIRESSCSPQRQEQNEQFAREHCDSMLFLPQEAALGRGQGPWIEEAMEQEKTRKARVKALGNSIVPQIAYLIGKRIMEMQK